MSSALCLGAVLAGLDRVEDQDAARRAGDRPGVDLGVGEDPPRAVRTLAAVQPGLGHGATGYRRGLVRSRIRRSTYRARPVDRLDELRRRFEDGTLGVECERVVADWIARPLTPTQVERLEPLAHRFHREIRGRLARRYRRGRRVLVSGSGLGTVLAAGQERALVRLDSGSIERVSLGDLSVI